MILKDKYLNLLKYFTTYNFVTVITIASLYGVIIPRVKNDMVRKFNTIDSEFQPYVVDFIKDIGINNKQIKTISIGFADLKDPHDGRFNTIGRCFPFKVPGFSPEILVDKTWWELSNYMEKKSLIYHELGHCVCYLMHSWVNGTYASAEKEELPDMDKRESAGYFKDGCAKGIMHPVDQGDFCTKKYWADYIKDLKIQCLK